METVMCSRCRQKYLKWHIVQRSARPVCRQCAAEGDLNKHGNRKVYEPSPEEIAEKCEAIRAGEDEETLMRRAGFVVEDYTIEEVHISPKMADNINVGRYARRVRYQ